MQRTKTYFEQIPVETVKRIATELPDMAETDGVPVSLKMQDKAASSPEVWRQLAQRIQEESDSAKMGELVQQLLDALDSRQSA